MAIASSSVAGLLRHAGMLLLPAAAAVILVACEDRNTTSEATASTIDTGAATAASTTDPVQRGEYLVNVMGGCNDCHTPLKMGEHGPEPDMSRMLSGHPEDMKMPSAPALGEGPWMVTAAATLTAWAGPWGVSYTMNLTPDTLTGLGNWTEEMFIKTLRTGKHMGTSRPIMPPMPWQNLSHATDDDLKAIYAYLRTIPPIRNQVPAYEPPAGGVAMAPSDGAKPDTTGM